MKNWKITKVNSENETHLKELFEKYSKSLSESTQNVLIGKFFGGVFNNQIAHKYFITNKHKSFNIQIFNICDVNLENIYKIDVKYFDKFEKIKVNINDIEKTIDEIIQSDRMANYIGYLIRISDKTKSNKIN